MSKKEYVELTLKSTSMDCAMLVSLKDAGKIVEYIGGVEHYPILKPQSKKRKEQKLSKQMRKELEI